jgi:hypothetical protein
MQDQHRLIFLNLARIVKPSGGVEPCNTEKSPVSSFHALRTIDVLRYNFTTRTIVNRWKTSGDGPQRGIYVRKILAPQAVRFV